jgi:hypothetical protein
MRQRRYQRIALAGLLAVAAGAAALAVQPASADKTRAEHAVESLANRAAELLVPPA